MASPCSWILIVIWRMQVVASSKGTDVDTGVYKGAPRVQQIIS